MGLIRYLVMAVEAAAAAEVALPLQGALLTGISAVLLYPWSVAHNNTNYYNNTNH